METLIQDLRYGLRLLLKSPGFTAIAVLALGLGIGANTAMFSVVNAVLLQPLPYHQPNRLMLAWSSNLAKGMQQWGTSPPDFYAFRQQNHSFEKLSAFYSRAYNLSGTDEPERLATLVVSSEFFGSLGVTPQLGRTFAASDEQWGSHRVVMLSDGVWRRRFAADPNVVGRAITVNGEPHVVVGVMRPDFSFLGFATQMWAPMSFAPGDNMNTHNNYFLNMVGRLKPGVTRDVAFADLNAIAKDIEQKFPENKGVGADLTLLQDSLVGDVKPALLVLMGAVGFVLLIACANIANLLLARAASRQREIAVRTALGASRSRLLRQFLTESVMLSALGGLVGLLIAFWSSDALHVVNSRILPRAQEVRLDPAVLGFTFAISLLTGVLFGLAPAMQSAATNLNEALKEGARGSNEGSARHRMRATLVIAEVALSLMLLIGAGLMLKSLRRLMSVDAGFDPRNVLTMEINLPAGKYVDEEADRKLEANAYARATDFFNTAIERVRSLPGVDVVGAVSSLPVMGENWGKTVTLYDRPLPASLDQLPHIQYRLVAGDYFKSLGIRMVRGRALTDRDTLQTPYVAVVNQQFAKQHYKNEDAIGKVISVDPPIALLPPGLAVPPGYAGPQKFTIVGVVEDVKYRSLSRDAVPLVYATFAQNSEGYTTMYLTVRATSDPLSLVGAVRHEIAQIDKNQPIANIATMESRVSNSVAQPRLEALLFGIFSGLAALLAAVGIYGVMSYSVTQRTREIGIRMALGAAQRDVLSMVLGQGFRLTAIGLAIGLAGALGLTRVLKKLLFGVSATDPAVFIAIAALLSAIALLATWVPARRATKVDPMVALRYE
jgi:putative ABC transport system permease protein